MADTVKLDELQIDIQVNSLKAQSNLELLAQSLKDVGRAGSQLKDVVSGLQDLGNASAKSETRLRQTADTIKDVGNRSREAKPSTSAMGKELKNMGSTARATTSALGNLVSSFKRIAMYRAMRSAIKAITEAFREGIENIKAWDLLVENTSYANQTMNTLKATAMQLANTLGALAIPILQLAIPALQALANAVMYVANFINQIIRTFQGYDTYIKATTLSIEEMNDATGRASASAKELKKTLFGFDDLNILPDQSRRGGGGGTGALWDYADMFKEVEVENTLARKIGKALENLKTKLAPAFGQMWEGAKQAASGLGGMLADIINGDFESAWENAKKTGKGLWSIGSGVATLGAQFNEFIKTYLLNPLEIAFNAAVRVIKAIIETMFDPKSLANPKKALETLAKDIEDIFNGAKNSLIGNYLVTEEAAKKAFGATEKYAADAGGYAKAVFTDSLKQTNSYLANNPVKYSTSVDPITNKVTNIFRAGQSAASKTGSVSFSSILKSISNASKIQKDAQGEANKFAPIAFTATVVTKGLGYVLSNAWWSLQKSLNDNPLAYSTTVGTVGVNTTTMLTRKNNIAQSYATGGVPDVGTLFYAGEAGAEVVANIGGRTGVMNVNQMEQAVANGNVDVINAIYGMANMIVNAVNRKDSNIYLDGAKVGQSVTTYQNNQMRRGVVY